MQPALDPKRPNARRLVRACVVASLAFLFLGTLVGFAAAGEPAPTVPDRFGVPAPWVGDRGEYNFTVVERAGDEHVVIVDEEPIARFEWLPPRDVLDAQGTPHRVNDLRYAARSLYGGRDLGVTGIAPGRLDEEKRGFTYGYDVESRSLVAYGLRADEKEDHEHMLMFLGPGDSTSRLPLCGIRNPLQGNAHDTDDSVQLFSDCNIEQRGRFSATFKAKTTDTLDGRSCLVYARQSPFVLFAWDDAEIYVWMCEGIPYPARIAVEHHAVEDRFSVYRLASWSRGVGPLDGPEVEPAAKRPPPILWATRHAWGPSDAGVEHPFPLSAAYRWAHMPGSAMATFLAAHPDAYVMQAEYKETRPEGRVERGWWFVLTDGVAVQPVGVIQTEAQGLRSLHYENQTQRAKTQLTESYAPPSVVPSSLPTVASLASWWDAYRIDDRDIPASLTWSFVIRPTIHGCAKDPSLDCKAQISMWVGRELHHPSEWFEHRPADWSRLQVVVDADSRQVRAASLNERPEFPETWQPAASFGGTGAHAFTVDVGVWRFPSGQYVVSASVVAILLGLLYWSWPAIKSFVAVGLFSRLERPRALESASRSQLFSLVEANPGIHFQELRRRLGWSPSRLRHHLSKLVGLGILTEVRTPGYSCYHASGALDRRVAQMLPALKSQGARTVLETVIANGRMGLQELVRSSRLDGATVHYHVHRLAQAGLLRQQRQGRIVTVEASAEAREVLAGAG